MNGGVGSLARRRAVEQVLAGGTGDGGRIVAEGADSRVRVAVGGGVHVGLFRCFFWKVCVGCSQF